jgi:hypothetical protein
MYRSDDTARSEVDVDGTRDTPPLAPATGNYLNLLTLLAVFQFTP